MFVCRYMGSMAKGITCDDINAFFDDDILPFVSAMMDQDNWSPRQVQTFLITVL